MKLNLETEIDLTPWVETAKHASEAYRPKRKFTSAYRVTPTCI